MSFFTAFFSLLIHFFSDYFRAGGISAGTDNHKKGGMK
jgi:hypothetical protein